jgi:hypothetical protein
MAINYDNERKYLNSLISQGGGKGEWAKQQAKKYAQQYEGFSLNDTTPSPQAGTQASHQSWINNPKSGQSGMNAYTQKQNQRYQEASATGNTDLLNRLKADSQRVGYALNDTAQQPAPKTSVQSSQPNWQSMVNNIYDQQRKSLMDQLKASRDKAVGQLDQQRSELSPQYQGLRNQSDVVNNQNANRLREIMASQGLSGSGDNVSAQTSLMAARQNALNSLNTQEQQQRNDYDRRISDLNNPDNENALMANLRAEQAKSLLNQFNTNRQFGLQEGQLMGNYNGQQTLASLNAARQNALGEGQLTGQYNGVPTLAAQNQAFNQAFSQDQFNYQQARDMIGDQRYQQQFDEDVRRFGIQSALDRQVKLGSLSMQQAQLALSQSKFGYQQQQDAIRNDQWQQEFETKLQQLNDGGSEIDEYDLLQVDSLATQSNIDYNSATPQDITSFVASLKSTYGWSTDEAKLVESYMQQKVNNTQAQNQQQQQTNQQNNLNNWNKKLQNGWGPNL